MNVSDDGWRQWEPKFWFLIFDPRSTPWVMRLCPGRYKHVSAAGYVAASDSWIVYSFELGRTRIMSIRGGPPFARWFSTVTVGCGVLKVAAAPFDTRRWRPRLGLWCVSAIKHLIAAGGGALWPDQLWRRLVASGAVVESDGQSDQAAEDSGKPGAASRAVGG